MIFAELELRDFGRIEHAKLELGVGLNVIFGPNDLGKSTVAAALRAVLLLPHTSSSASSFIPWDRDATPQVSLVFRSKDHRWFRVHKSWGKGSRGSSLLESSADGQQWTVIAKARQVDAELRELFGWGIASPGGKGAPKGMPQSFLTKVLLGEQADVASILEQTLAADSDEEGRARLTAALGAYAQHPLFKSVLDRAQEHVDEAFLASGSRRRGRRSPMWQAQQDLERRKEELDRAQKELDATQRVEEEVSSLRETLTQAIVAKERAQTTLNAIAKAEAHRAAHDSAHQRVVELGQQLAAVEQNVERLAKLKSSVDALQQDLDEADKGQAKALELVQEARAQLEARQVEATRSEAQSPQAQRAQAIQEMRQELEQTEAALRSTRLRRELSTEIDKLEVEREHATKKLKSAIARVDEVERRRLAAELRELEQRIVEYEEHISEGEDLEKTGAARDQEAAALDAQLESGLPNEERLEEIRGLRRQLEVAQARLAVGIRVKAETGERVTIEAERDGEPITQGPLRADQELRLMIRREGEMLADLQIRGAKMMPGRSMKRSSSGGNRLLSHSSNSFMSRMSTPSHSRFELKRALGTKLGSDDKKPKGFEAVLKSSSRASSSSMSSGPNETTSSIGILVHSTCWSETSPIFMLSAKPPTQP